MDCCRVSGFRLADGSVVVVRGPALASHRPGFESQLYQQKLWNPVTHPPQASVSAFVKKGEIIAST